MNHFGSFSRSLLLHRFTPQSCLFSSAQGNQAEVRHEENQQAESDVAESDTAGLCGERHPHLCRESLCCLHVLLLRDAAAPVHGDGVCRRSAAAEYKAFCFSSIACLYSLIYFYFFSPFRRRLRHLVEKHGSPPGGYGQDVFCRNCSCSGISSQLRDRPQGSET